jgi:signal transduction histidine kinase
MDTDLEIIHNLRDNFKVGLIRANSQGFLYMNAEALAMFGFTSLHEAASQPRRILFADCDSYQHLVTKQNAYGILTDERVLFSRQDRSNFWGLLTSRVHVVGEEVFYDEMIIDITDKVNIERRLTEKTHLLEKVGNELDRFIYSASHDLRSPVSSMKGLVNLFRVNGDIFSCAQFLDMMEGSLNNLERFIKMLVEFSKTTNQPVVVEPVNLGKIIASVLQELKTHPSSGKVQVECVAPGSALIYSDFNKLYTVLSNTIKNAFDFLDPAKPSGLVAIKAEINNEKATVEIIDNGIGIDKRYIPTIFQMFYRASSLSKGSGLGLYVAREAIVRLGGSINIRSEYGLGTFVSIQIPNEVNRAYGEDVELKTA